MASRTEPAPSSQQRLTQGAGLGPPVIFAVLCVGGQPAGSGDGKCGSGPPRVPQCPC